jgi:hypothetical protein
VGRMERADGASRPKPMTRRHARQHWALVERTRGSSSLPFFSKEILQDLAALRFSDTGGNQAGMV